ncbi:MAG TPA: alpha/beta hydrolase [Gemmatimonadales bacterium]|nr:alpha/beta hydrolase [Gemmatimonadales bacterium]
MRQDFLAPGRAPQAGGRGARERLLAGLPVVEHRIDLAGVSTAVLVGGEGPPLVLLHGPGEHALKWARVIPALVREHRVIAPDLPGHGSSASDGRGMSAEEALQWLGELLDATCPVRPVLLGQITGGAMAARLAAGGGHRLAHLVLVDSLGLAPFNPTPEFGQAIGAFLAEPGELTFDRLWRRCAFDLERLRATMGEQWEAYATYSLERGRTPEVRGAVHRLMEQFGFPAIPAEVLARIEVPTALIWGRHDLATSLSVAEEASRRYRWPLWVVEDAADDPAFEQPARFVETLRAVVSRSAVSQAPRTIEEGGKDGVLTA